MTVIERTTTGVGVSLVDLHRTYGTLHALDGLSLDIAPGEMVARRTMLCSPSESIR